MTDREREIAIRMYMREENMSREEAEEYVDTMEDAMAGWESPCQWSEAERNWNDRNPRLKDEERI